MLYDNALLAVAYLRAFERTGDAFFARVAEKTLLYIRRELGDPDGGLLFLSGRRQRRRVEGKHYLFSSRN
jgi:uncharacterized protein YyaL (SSP411 family)